MKEPNKSSFRRWLQRELDYQPGPINDALSRCQRVERCYGPLDDLYDKDRLVSLLTTLVCSPSGQPRHRIPFSQGADTQKGTASLRSAVTRYQEFRNAIERAVR